MISTNFMSIIFEQIEQPNILVVGPAIEGIHRFTLFYFTMHHNDDFMSILHSDFSFISLFCRS
jgi:hypothetical protein